MTHFILTSNQFQSNQWSGGTTRELYIFPPESQYKERNFQFRISLATVEVETSKFTALPGVSRKLMVLSGQITIRHQNKYSRNLHPFDLDSFEGDWKTYSVGKCTDFNLMTTGKTTGNIHAMEIQKDQSDPYCPKEVCDWLFIYAFAGSITIHINSKTDVLNMGDLLVIPPSTQKQIEIKANEASKLIFADIKT